MRFEHHVPALANPTRKLTLDLLARGAGVFAMLISNNVMASTPAPARTASLTRSINVNSSPAAVWAAIGPFCSISEWHPAIASCSEDGKSPPTRTLKTRDGDATFVELQTARNTIRHSYSYTFTSAPIPVTNYNSTLSVVANGHRGSTVRWSGVYRPNPGMDRAAANALSGIYVSGLQSIQARLAKPKR